VQFRMLLTSAVDGWGWSTSRTGSFTWGGGLRYTLTMRLGGGYISKRIVLLMCYRECCVFVFCHMNDVLSTDVRVCTDYDVTK
jgi:hypothetical protein